MTDRPLRRYSLALLGSAGLLLSGCGKAKVGLTVFHTNAIYGRLGARDGKGGFAVLAKAVASESGPKLLVDTGNWFQGTPEGMLSRGRAVIELMDAVGYDAAAVGSHDFEYGQKNLKELAESASFPVLAANVYDGMTGSRPGYFKERIIKDVGGIKVGLFGLASRRVPLETDPSDVAGLRFRREADEAEKQVAALRKDGAKVVIALSHAGLEPANEAPFEGDKYLAGHVDGLDLIVGGKCGDDSSVPWRDPVKGTLVACTQGYLKQVGRAELRIDADTGKVVGVEDESVDLSVDKFGQDEKVQKLIEKWTMETAKEMDHGIATAKAAIERNRWAESQLGDWMADCMRSATGAQAAFINSGAIRADLPAGMVTRRALFEAMPFEDGLFTVRVSGRQIRAALERGFSGDRGVLQISGLSVQFDPSALPGLRVGRVTIDGKPMKDNGVYKVAVSEFLADGGDGFLEFSEGADAQGDGRLLRDTLESCARRQASLIPPPLERVQVSSL